MGGLLQIEKVEMVLTSRCNLKCSYCFEDDKKDLRMDWEIARASIDRALASRKPHVDVVFFGGEPMLEFDTIRRAVAYASERPARRRRLQFTLITNGTLLDRGSVEFLVRNSFDLQISFDGVVEAQRHRGKGTFEALDVLLDGLRRDHPRYFRRRVSVAMTLTARTIPWLARSVDYFLGKDVREIVLSPKYTFEPAWRDDLIGDLRAQFREVFRVSARHFRRTGRVPLALFRKSGARIARPRRPTMCGVVRGEQLAVDVDGQSHGCIVFSESYQRFSSPLLRGAVDAIRLGDVRDSSALDASLSGYSSRARPTGLFHDKQEKYSSYARCGTCRFLASCNVCPASIGHLPGNADPRRVPDFLCAFNLVSLAYRARFPVRRDVPASRVA